MKYDPNVYGYVNGKPTYSRDEFIFTVRGFGPIENDADLLAFAEKVTSRWYNAGWHQTFATYYLSDYALSEPGRSLTVKEFNRLKELQQTAREAEKAADDAREWKLHQTIYWADNSVEEIWIDKNGAITYDYSDGWKTLLTRDFPTVFLLIALVVCIIISPVFAYEYQTGADAVVLSSKYGRRETVWAKLIAGFTVTSRIYFIAVLMSLISVLAVFGVQGWNCDFQILSTTAYYGLKIWQVVFVGIVINYVVVLSVMAFTMLLSAACKTPFAAVLISTLCTIVPMFLPTSRVSGVFNKLLCLLPAKAMDTHVVFSTYVLFSFGKLVIILPCMILIAACVLIIVTLPVAHRKFCRHQVA